MAKGSNKSRIVIWTIVGLLVVTAVVFLIVGRKGTSTDKPFRVEDVPKFVRLYSGRIDKVASNADEARGNYGADANEVFAEVDSYVEACRAGLAEIQDITDPEALVAKQDEIQENYRAAKRILREIK